MTHTLDWTAQGWCVATRLGPITIARAYYAEYGDALRAFIALQGGA